MNPEETLAYLYRRFPMFQEVGKAGYKPGLETILALDSHFGHPSTRFLSVHIAGTNGKGSVSHMLASVLQQAGFKTGLFTSPHLKDFRERIRINGRMISQEKVVEFVDQGRDFFETVQPSFFDVTTAMAFHHFARNGVEVAVIETGLGGRLDSTNIIRPQLTVVTNVQWDHMSYLGNTLPEIAAEKAGIMKPGVAMILGEPQPEIVPVFAKRSEALGSPLILAPERYSLLYAQITDEGTQRFTLQPATRNQDASASQSFMLEVDLAGRCQQKNILTLCAALSELRKLPPFAPLFSESDLIDASTCPGPIITRGLQHAARRTGLMGRWQQLGSRPLTVADTAHNPDGLSLSLAQAESTPHRTLRFVVGFMADKDIEAILPLLPRQAHYYFTKAALPRSLAPEKLQQMAEPYTLRGACYETVQQALAKARADSHPDDLIYIGGSTFVVAEALP